MRNKEQLEEAKMNPRDIKYGEHKHGESRNRHEDDSNLFDKRVNHMHRHVPNEDPSKEELQRRIRWVLLP